jgi:hypothetical protein
MKRPKTEIQEFGGAIASLANIAHSHRRLAVEGELKLMKDDFQRRAVSIRRQHAGHGNIADYRAFWQMNG